MLQPQERRSRIPGDSPEAVAARRRFLDRGFAEPLLNAIRSILPDAEAVLDAGCGDGYYLGSLGRGGCGIDISTAAIDLAARRYPDCEWIVTNADRFIPYAGASFDLILSITGRMNLAEFRRVGRSWLLVAIAAPDDLIELRGKPNRDRVQRTVETFANDFELVKRERATTIAELDAEDARDVLLATYRPRAAAPTRCTLSLDLLLFRLAAAVAE
jgi:23S rRNA (guanine745-N1)-methyltransferase